MRWGSAFLYLFSFSFFSCARPSFFYLFLFHAPYLHSLFTSSLYSVDSLRRGQDSLARVRRRHVLGVWCVCPRQGGAKFSQEQLA